MSFSYYHTFKLFFLLLSFLLKNCKFEIPEQSRDTSSLVDYSFKSFELKPLRNKFDMKTLIPKHIQLYIAAAFSEKDFPSFSKIFNKTLSSIPNNFLITDSLNRQYKVSISPLFFVLPDSGRFSSSIYEVMCNSFDRKRVASILVIGENPAAFTVSLAAVTSNIPVLWARGGNVNPLGSLEQQTSLEIRLEPGEAELFEAIRGVFLATHWHSFTVMAVPSLAARCASILSSPPLNPKVVSFTRNPHLIFRKLADISRSTRGVVLLLCEVSDAILIMDVAKRLNMIDGHFVWIWIDTTAKPASFLTLPTSRLQNMTQKIAKYLDKSKKLKKIKSDYLYQSDDSMFSNSNTSNGNHDRYFSHVKKSMRKQMLRNKRMVSSENYDWKRQSQKYAEKSNLKEIAGGEGRKPIDATESFNKNSKTYNSSDNAENNNPQTENETGSFLNRGMIKDKKPSNENNGTNLMDNLKSKTANKSQETVKKYIELTKSKKKLDNLKMKNLETERLAVTDYLNDFAMQLDQSFDENDDEDDKEKGEVLVNKAWGKILENFPIRSPDMKEEEKEKNPKDTNLPIGLLSVKPESVKLDRYLVKGSVRLLVSSLHSVLKKSADWLSALDSATSCWIKPSSSNKNFSETYAREIRKAVQESLSGKFQFQEGDRADRALLANFQILNLVPEKFNINFYNDINFIEDAILYWRQVGKVTGQNAHLNTIVWPGGDLVASALSAKTRSVFRIVTALAPPFVMEGALDEDGQCLRGVICYRVLNSDKDNLTLAFNEMDTQERLEDEVREFGGDDKTEKPFRFIDHAFLEYYSTKYKYKSSCCYGLTMDLLENIAQELEFEFHLYITPDGAYGAKNHVWEEGGPRYKWNGIVGDLVSGAAHMSFAALSVSKQRSQVIDFSTPYFFSGVSFLAAPTQKSEIPLLAFLLPFSPELWIAIFTSLNITAMAVACYEWLSPFGLNPWGRQRSRNFSIASALWVMWGLLCGHLVAFKAPKSWPNKFLINVWGGFSVIFVASYTANIAALIAGLFFHNSVSDYHDRSLLSQRVGAPKSSAADYYIHRANQHLWEHMQKYSFKDVETGIALLRNGSLDILIADTPILDYYRATDHGCKLQKIVEAINDDTYAIGMNKGFPLKESISAVISKYSNNGFMDILTEKWYGGLPCFKMMPSVELTDVGQPRPLGVAAVAGVFLLLGLGVVVGVLILIIEHLFYRYTLPILRHQPKGTIWRSRNIMFFSQKLYRFINCVELVSPHHAARELVHTLRQGQITSLFQKSVKRKEHEQRRRRRSKAQFFEMIQEIRRVQQEEKDEPRQLDNFGEKSESPKSPLRSFLTSPRSLKNFCSTKIAVSPQISVDSGEVLSFYENNQHVRSSSKSPSRLDIRRFSKELFSLPKSPKTKSSTSLDIRRFSSDMDDKKGKNDLRASKTDVRLSAKDIRIQTSNAIGRRLSKDTTSWLISSPPDLNSRRKSHLDITNAKSLSVSQNILDDSTKASNEFNSTKFFTVGPTKSNEYNKELLSKSMTLTPVISKAATLRLASSGGLDVPKPVKSRPRLPSPPPSPVIDFRNSKTPKISVSDTSCDAFNVYDTILPHKEDLSSQRTSVRNSHGRSKSLDGKHLNFIPTVINIENMDSQKNNLKSERQTVNYATLEHKRNNFENETDKSKNINEKFASIKSSSIVKEKQTLNEGRAPVSKNAPLPITDVKKTPVKESKTVWNNAKEDMKNVLDKRQMPSPKIDNLKGPEVKSEIDEVTYAEPQKLKKEKKEREEQQQPTPTRKTQIEIKHSKPDISNKPKVPPKSNALKQMQARVYSAPDSTCRQAPATILFIPEETFKIKTMAGCNYYPDRKIFQRSQTEPSRYEQCTERCFQTFPSNRLCPYMSVPESYRSKTDADRRFATTGRSSSVPEQKFFISSEPGCRNDDCYRRRRTDNPVVVLQHSSRSLDIPSKNPGILKNRRRSKSRDCDELPPAPPSPPERSRSRYERSEAQSNREILLTIKRHSQGYKEPP